MQYETLHREAIMQRNIRDMQPHPMWLFEENYMMLRKLFPDFTPGVWLLSAVGECNVINVSIERCGPYTSSVLLYVPIGDDEQLLRPLTFEVRVYNDARVAEAHAYQNCRNIPPTYAASSVKGFVRDERSQTNRFLHEVLRFFLERRYAISYLADAV